MDVLPWSHLVCEQSWTGELWTVFSRTEILEICSEAGYCGSGWVDWDFLDWGWVLLVTALNSLRVRISYKEKQIWCALLRNQPCLSFWKVPALPLGLLSERQPPAQGYPFTEPLWPPFSRPRTSDTCTHTHMLTWETMIVETQHWWIFPYSNIFLSYLTPSTIQ